MAESFPPGETFSASEDTLRRLRRLVDRFRDGTNTTVDEMTVNVDLSLLHNLREMTMRVRRSSMGNYRNGTPRASKSAIEALAKESVEDGDAVECAVCNDCVFGVGVLVTRLPCGHGYHGDCIVPWLERRNSCPLCRFELETDDPEYEEARIGRAGSSS